jgi:hypothetical protein
MENQLPKIDLVGLTVPLFHQPFKSTGTILCAEDTVDWLKAQRQIVGWTYTLSDDFLLKLSIDRVIAGKPYNGGFKLRVKVAQATHVKCYIGQSEMYIGSFNLTHPTIEDLGVIVKDKKQIKTMRAFFEKSWKAL